MSKNNLWATSTRCNLKMSVRRIEKNFALRLLEIILRLPIDVNKRPLGRVKTSIIRIKKTSM